MLTLHGEEDERCRIRAKDVGDHLPQRVRKARKSEGARVGMGKGTKVKKKS